MDKITYAFRTNWVYTYLVHTSKKEPPIYTCVYVLSFTTNTRTFQIATKSISRFLNKYRWHAFQIGLRIWYTLLCFAFLKIFFILFNFVLNLCMRVCVWVCAWLISTVCIHIVTIGDQLDELCSFASSLPHVYLAYINKIIVCNSSCWQIKYDWWLIDDTCISIT